MESNYLLTLTFSTLLTFSRPHPLICSVTRVREGGREGDGQGEIRKNRAINTGKDETTQGSEGKEDSCDLIVLVGNQNM